MRTVLAFSLPLAALAAPAAFAAAPSASVTRADDGAYIVRWSAEATPADVYVATSPDAAIEAMTLVSGDDADGEHVVAAPDDGARLYFAVAAGEDSVRVAERVLPLEGGRNFRDLGGYATEDGRTVKWGAVYRSGVMHELTDGDYDYLANLGIGVVCDFRDARERASEPTDWRAGAIDYVAWDYSNDPSELGELFGEDMSADKSRAGMTALYHDIGYEHAERFAEMFDRLAAGQTPLAFNCSAGKDRTGTAAALLLTALGVPRETVVADYAMSEKVVDYMAVYRGDLESQDAEAGEENPYAFLAQVPPEVLAPLLRSDPAYIEAAFAEFESRHGSVMAFIQEELDVTDEELAQLRANLLE